MNTNQLGITSITGFSDLTIVSGTTSMSNEREALQTLLQHLTENYQNHSVEIHRVQELAGITTTVQYKKFADDGHADIFEEKRNYVVQVFRPFRPHQAETFDFESQAAADYFAGVQRGEIAYLDVNDTVH